MAAAPKLSVSSSSGQPAAKPARRSCAPRRRSLTMTRLFLPLALAFLPAAALAQGSDRAAVRNACAADFQKNCPGIQPGGGRLAACLKEKRAAFSEACLTTLQQARAQRAAN
jgi:hypothetical protein